MRNIFLAIVSVTWGLSIHIESEYVMPNRKI